MENVRLKEKEKEKIVERLVNKDFTIVEVIWQAFKPLIKKVYKREIENEDIISEEEFNQEVVAILCKRIRNFRGTSYGEISNFIEKTINLHAKNTRKKYKKIFERHISLENLERKLIQSAKITSPTNVEEEVIEIMLIKLIRKKINEILKEHEKITLAIMLEGVNLRAYADKNGEDYEKLRRDRKKLINKFRKDEELKSIWEIYKN